MRRATVFLRFLRRVWTDDAGFVISAELVLVGSLLVIGLIVGLTSVRNQVVQELADVGQAVGSISQSYAYPGIMKPCMAWTDGSFYLDKVDFCQDGGKQVPGNEPGGLMMRLWPQGIPAIPPNGELGNRESLECCGGSAVAGGSCIAQWLGYPACCVRAEVRTEAGGMGRLDAATKTAAVDYKLVVSIDPEKYDAFQASLVRCLESLAIRKGQWSAAIVERKDTLPVDQGCLPPGCVYEGVVDVRNGERFHAGDWGTDQADLGRETVIVVNTLRDHRRGQSRWAWFNVPRSERSLRSGLEVKVEFLGADGRAIAQDVIPVCVGYNWSPPGMEVFDLYNRREADYRTLWTLGAKNRDAAAAVVAQRRQDPQRRSEDLLVMVSPYLSVSNGGDPPASFATQLVIPLVKKLAADDVGKLKEIRATVLGCERAGLN